MTKREVVRMRKIQPAEMSVAADAKVTDLDRVWSNIADQRRTHEKSVAIEFNAATIVVVVKTSLDRVALAYEILAKDVRDVNVLVAGVEAIQTAVRIFLEHREIRCVELVTIVFKRAEHASAEVIVGKDEAAEVGDRSEERRVG